MRNFGGVGLCWQIDTNKAILGEMVENLGMSKMVLLKETPLIQRVDELVFPLEKERFGKVKGMVFGAFGVFLIVMVILVITKLIKVAS